MKPIGVLQFCGRWYLYWKHDKVTIASFPSETEAYSARRYLLSQQNGTVN